MESFKVIFCIVFCSLVCGCLATTNPYLIDHPEPMKQAADLGGQALSAALSRISKGIDPTKPINDACELNEFIKQYLKAPKEKVIYNDKFDPDTIGAAIKKDKESHENDDLNSVLQIALVVFLTMIGYDQGKTQLPKLFKRRS